MQLAGKRFLVIGGAGLIGSHVVERALSEDVAEVIIFDNFARGTSENLATALKDSRCSVYDVGGDILHTDVLQNAVRGVDGVFHLAALWLLQCQEFPRAAFDVNIRGTFNVVEACIQAGVNRLVYSSSSSVYGDALSEPMTEDHPYNNTTFYGATKIAGEHMCRAFANHQGLAYVALRYMNVYGPRQDYRGAYTGVIMNMLDRLHQGLPPVVHGDGSQSYDFVHVTDCAASNLAAMQADTTDEFYNVGTGICTSILEIAEMLIEITGASVDVEFAPETQSFVQRRVGSPTKACHDLRFSAKVELREGLTELVAWHREDVRREQ
ncbi:MAG: NAD-dependent epimerase/dehydratase family protein [Candidatus Latescibacteria bacterium]|jgi:UDP-glucose 4-epimerase|nr:NAD-dependent epimerase/dehydratase family protein [Candidatus Latescibacterota bacterium]